MTEDSLDDMDLVHLQGEGGFFPGDDDLVPREVVQS